MKDREKEEYTSELHRERDSSAEKSFVSKDVEGSFGVVLLKEMAILWVGEAGRPRYRSKRVRF